MSERFSVEYSRDGGWCVLDYRGAAPRAVFDADSRLECWQWISRQPPEDHSAPDVQGSGANTSQDGLPEDDPTNPVPEAEGGGELIARLRAVPRGVSEYGCQNCDENLKAEAADAIEAAEARARELLKALRPFAAYAADMITPSAPDGFEVRVGLFARDFRRVLTALSSEAPPVVCGGEDGSARASVAEPGSQERAAVVPAAEQAGRSGLEQRIDAAILGLNPLTGYGEDSIWRPVDRARSALIAAREEIARQALPIDMVLFCPACGFQHIDAPDEDATAYADGRESRWDNPPHRSHLCHGCGHIWRPADVSTNGVRAILTKGKADTTPPPDHDAIPSAEGGSGKDTRDEENGLREKIALVLDEVAVTATQGNPRRHIEQRRRWAYSRADQILALLQSPRGEA